MRTLIIGASGFIGRHLAEHLDNAGHAVTVTSRNIARARAILGNRYEYISWDGTNPDRLANHLESIDAVVNLAGENIAAGRWSESMKERFVSSRVRTGKALAAAIMVTNNKPSVLLQGSATGIYGTHVEGAAGEKREPGQGFLADLTRQWEDSVSGLAGSDLRIVLLRTGLVLGKNAGLLPRLSMPFNFGIGVIPGNGNQWLPWIHIRDEVGAIRFLIENPSARGPYNLTAPEPVTMKQMVRKIGKLRSRPAWFSIPPSLLKLALGEMARETILASQDVIPEALMEAGYPFEYKNIEDALYNLIKKHK